MTKKNAAFDDLLRLSAEIAAERKERQENAPPMVRNGLSDLGIHEVAALSGLIRKRIPTLQEWADGATVPGWIPKKSWWKTPKVDRERFLNLRSDLRTSDPETESLIFELIRKKVTKFKWVTLKTMSMIERQKFREGDDSVFKGMMEVPASVVKEHWFTSERPIWDARGNTLDDARQNVLAHGGTHLEAADKLQFCKSGLTLLAVVTDEAMNKAFPIAQRGRPQKYDAKAMLEALVEVHGPHYVPKYGEAKKIWALLGEVPSESKYRAIIANHPAKKKKP